MKNREEYREEQRRAFWQEAGRETLAMAKEYLAEKRILCLKPQGEEMSKEDLVLQAQNKIGDVLGEFYEASKAEGVASVPTTPGGATPEQVAQAVADGVAAAQAADQALLDAQVAADNAAMAAAQADATQKMADLQAVIDSLGAKVQVDEQVVNDFKAKAAELQSALDVIKNLSL